MVARKHGRCTEEELARESGKSVRQIRNRVAQGVIVPGPDGLFDRRICLETLAMRANGGRPRKDADDAADGEASAPGPAGKRKRNWLEVRTREDALKARLQRLEIQGKLVRRSAVEAAWAEQATMVRDQLMQLGPRMADRLASETDPRVCSQLVSDEVRTALRALSEVE